MPKQDFLQITDFGSDELRGVFHLAKELKKLTIDDRCPKPLEGKSLGCIFHKPSLRTRISFEVGIFQLGGHSLYITKNEIDLGVRESIADAARVLSRYLDAIIIRTFSHKDVEELAEHASIPVINALTDYTHPCQVISDLMTIEEYHGTFEGRIIAYLGDGNNVARSWINAARRLPIKLRIGTTPETHPGELFEVAKSEGAEVEIFHDPAEAVTGAHVVYTDVFASMGEKEQAEKRLELLSKFQVNSDLVKLAHPNAIIMHCLPAERGREITDEVIDSPQSVVFDQAENRLHAQKAILVTLLG